MAGLPGTQCRRRIYLMRHGDVRYFDDAGKPLDPRTAQLTQTGERNARMAGALLADVAFDQAICSGLPRTEQTARAVLGARTIALRCDARLREVRAGRLRDIPIQQREAELAYAYEQAGAPGARFAGGELIADARRRVLEVWFELVADDSWLQMLIVAHDAVNRMLLAEIVGVGLQGLKAFEQDPACINIIEVDVENGRVLRGYLRAVNLVAYNLTRQDDHLTVMEKVFRQYSPD